MTEVGILTSATDPDTLVWYDVEDPITFPSGVRNEIEITMDFDRIQR